MCKNERQWEIKKINMFSFHQGYLVFLQESEKLQKRAEKFNEMVKLYLLGIQ